MQHNDMAKLFFGVLVLLILFVILGFVVANNNNNGDGGHGGHGGHHGHGCDDSSSSDSDDCNVLSEMRSSSETESAHTESTSGFSEKHKKPKGFGNKKH